MNQTDLEGEVIRMGDVGVAINMVDACVSTMDPDQTERAVIILKEIFSRRYERLRCCVYGGR